MGEREEFEKTWDFLHEICERKLRDLGDESIDIKNVEMILDKLRKVISLLQDLRRKVEDEITSFGGWYRVRKLVPAQKETLNQLRNWRRYVYSKEREVFRWIDSFNNLKSKLPKVTKDRENKLKELIRRLSEINKTLKDSKLTELINEATRSIDFGSPEKQDEMIDKLGDAIKDAKGKLSTAERERIEEEELKAAEEEAEEKTKELEKAAEEGRTPEEMKKKEEEAEKKEEDVRREAKDLKTPDGEKEAKESEKRSNQRKKRRKTARKKIHKKTEDKSQRVKELEKKVNDLKKKGATKDELNQLIEEAKNLQRRGANITKITVNIGKISIKSSEEKKTEISAEEKELADKTRAQLVRCVKLANDIVDSVNKIPKTEEKITENAEREFKAAIDIYTSTMKDYKSIIMNEERFLNYVNNELEPYSERLFNAAAVSFKENGKKLRSAMKKFEEEVIIKDE